MLTKQARSKSYVPAWHLLFKGSHVDLSIGIDTWISIEVHRAVIGRTQADIARVFGGGTRRDVKIRGG